MNFDVETITLINLIVQIVVAVALLISVGIIWGGMKNQHCWITRLALIIQILAVIFVMFPSMLGYEDEITKPGYLKTEILIHHIVGLTTAVVGIVINLTFKALDKRRALLLFTMRTALLLWFIALGLGIHLYVVIT